MMKRVLHDWNDAECHQMLSTLHRAAPQRGRVWIIERSVPGPDTPHCAKLFDVFMIIVSTGRERTLEPEFEEPRHTLANSRRKNKENTGRASPI
jgi:hypothetical protein